MTRIAVGGLAPCGHPAHCCRVFEIKTQDELLDVREIDACNGCLISCSADGASILTSVKNGRFRVECTECGWSEETGV
jgi:hypothetical protein